MPNNTEIEIKDTYALILANMCIHYNDGIITLEAVPQWLTIEMRTTVLELLRERGMNIQPVHWRFKPVPKGHCGTIPDGWEIVPHGDIITEEIQFWRGGINGWAYMDRFIGNIVGVTKPTSTGIFIRRKVGKNA